jgi:glyoxylate reductase/hydroxypyruvate reductase 2
MHPILAFPPLAGMTYPQLEGMMRIAAEPSDIEDLSADERATVRVLMTSASRGCSEQMANALPNLGLVVSQGVGSEKIDIAGLERRGVKVRCVGEALTDDVADLAMCLTMMLVRDLVRADSFARDGSWGNVRFHVGESLVGMTVGIGGLSGRIGQAIAARAQVSKMRLAGLDRPSNLGLGAALYNGWKALAQASDILVLAVPGIAGQGPVIGAAELSALGPRGRLVNVGRGSLVDTNALIDALEKGTIAGAALDVLDTEPDVPPRLAVLTNLILTPHIGGQTWGQRARGAKIAEDEIMDFLKG